MFKILTRLLLCLMLLNHTLTYEVKKRTEMKNAIFKALSDQETEMDPDWLKDDQTFLLIKSLLSHLETRADQHQPKDGDLLLMMPKEPNSRKFNIQTSK